MLELRQVGIYLLGLVLVVAVLSAGAVYAALESVRFVPLEPDVSTAAKKSIVLASTEDDAGDGTRRNGPPVWIAPTPKYDYDPKLMIVKPREERLKEAELRRKQEAAKYMAKQRADQQAKQKVAQQRHQRQLRHAESAYAYQPEVRTPAFGIFSIFR